MPRFPGKLYALGVAECLSSSPNLHDRLCVYFVKHKPKEIPKEAHIPTQIGVWLAQYNYFVDTE